jgi:hypothetical protein
MTDTIILERETTPSNELNTTIVATSDSERAPIDDNGPICRQKKFSSQRRG